MADSINSQKLNPQNKYAKFTALKRRFPTVLTLHKDCCPVDQIHLISYEHRTTYSQHL